MNTHGSFLGRKWSNFLLGLIETPLFLFVLASILAAIFVGSGDGAWVVALGLGAFIVNPITIVVAFLLLLGLNVRLKKKSSSNADKRFNFLSLLLLLAFSMGIQLFNPDVFRIGVIYGVISFIGSLALLVVYYLLWHVESRKGLRIYLYSLVVATTLYVLNIVRSLRFVWDEGFASVAELLAITNMPLYFFAFSILLIFNLRENTGNSRLVRYARLLFRVGVGVFIILLVFNVTFLGNGNYRFLHDWQQYAFIPVSLWVMLRNGYLLKRAVKSSQLP